MRSPRYTGISSGDALPKGRCRPIIDGRRTEVRLPQLATLATLDDSFPGVDDPTPEPVRH
jgi:hypothetical protein